MQKLKNFINGEYVDPQSGEYLDNFDPATGEVYAQIPDSNELDVAMAVQSASKAFETWSKTTAEERATIMHRIADVLDSKKEELAKAESKDVGKPQWLALKADMARVATNFRFFASKIVTMEDKSYPGDENTLHYSVREPVGVCGLIAPWNLPLYLMTWKIAPCIAMGNTAVCKPSEVTPMTTFMLGEILNEAGLPPGVVNVVHGRGTTAGATLVKHPKVPVISFTGGTETGKIISELAAPHFKKVSLELGGKNANIIFKDANLKKAVATTLRSSFLNSGQICLCGSRVMVQQDIYDEFMAEFKKQASEIKVGDPSDDNSFMGPLVSKDQHDKVLSSLAQAKEEQGKITVGGGTPKVDEKFKNGYWLEPTIIEDLSNCSELWQNEIFGPVVTVMSFKYPKDAVEWANNTSYGLSASIWTQDLKRAHKVASQLQAGTVWVNTWMKRDLRVPFGGYKHSGLGREGGDHSLNIYSEHKTITVNLEK